MSGRDTPGVSGAGQTPVGESRQAAGRFHCRTSAPGRAIVGDEGGCPLRGVRPLGERSNSILSRTYRPAVGASEDAPSAAVGGTVPEGLAPDCPARRRSGDRLAFGNPRSPARVGDPEAAWRWANSPVRGGGGSTARRSRIPCEIPDRPPTGRLANELVCLGALNILAVKTTNSKVHCQYYREIHYPDAFTQYKLSPGLLPKTRKIDKGLKFLVDLILKRFQVLADLSTGLCTYPLVSRPRPRPRMRSFSPG